jgi:2-polyprenyl-3-methyl-5-hydroxy-6-metoxy-1,4-benzoquinol methylase
MNDEDAWDGIWCMASLLHVPPEKQAEVWKRLADALKPGGVIFACYKNVPAETSNAEAAGFRTRIADGRTFVDLDETELSTLAENAGLSILKVETVAVAGTAEGRPVSWTNGLFLRPRHHIEASDC